MAFATFDHLFPFRIRWSQRITPRVEGKTPAHARHPAPQKVRFNQLWKRYQIHALQASTEGELDAAFASLRQLQAGALMIGTDPFLNTQSKQLGALAARYAIPTIYQYREFAAAGGLMSYGMVNTTDPNRLVGAYAGRILKGEKPSDLPVQQPTKIELIVNLNTARALGLDVPPSLLARADEVIE